MLKNLVARQSVLDSDLNTWGYELLFRSGVENAFVVNGVSVDGDDATMSVMNNAFLSSMNHICGDARCLINFTRKLLIEDYAFLLPKQRIIIEILEDIEPDMEVYNACERLKKAGYTIALDDFFFKDKYRKLLELVDIVKVDFMISSEKSRTDITNKLKVYDVELLAEKVETYFDFEQAKKLGYDYFQGYFFSRPVMLKNSKVEESKLLKLQLISELNSSEFVIENIEKIFRNDPALTIRLFKYLNSSYFSFNSEIRSIKQAVMLLGQLKLRKWATVLSFADMISDKPVELFKGSVFKARFCELLGKNQTKEFQNDLFLLGLLADIDAFFDMSKEDILEDVTINTNIKDVLLDKKNGCFLYKALHLAQSLEYGILEDIDSAVEDCNIKSEIIVDAYSAAIVTARELGALLEQAEKK